MTNIATLIQNHPDIIPQIEKISICAARTPGLLFNPGNGKLNVFDYNYELDTKSMDVILILPFHLYLQDMNRVHTLISEILIWLV
jgi:pyrimidine-specific ribonucleoside hydrolase